MQVHLLAINTGCLNVPHAVTCNASLVHTILHVKLYHVSAFFFLYFFFWFKIKILISLTPTIHTKHNFRERQFYENIFLVRKPA